MREEYYACEHSSSGDFEVREAEPPWAGDERKVGPFRFSGSEKVLSAGNRKQLILLALKNSLDIGDRTISNLSLLTGLHPEVLFHIVGVLRFCMRRKIERMNSLQERRNRNYFRIKCLVEERSQCSCEARSRDLERRIAQERKRWETTRRELSHVPRCPAHGDIARLLGIPKGSVDSGIFNLKRYL
jgi:hypothetical protein